MDTGKIITTLGFAAGAYFAYESGLLTTLTGGLVPAPNAKPGGASSSPPPSSSGNPPTNPASPPPAPPPTEALVLAAMKADNAIGLQTFDTYNYYYQQKRGVAGPDPSTFLPADQRSKLLSADEWWSYMKGAGFSGGVGVLVPRRSSLGGYVASRSLGRWIY